MIDAKKVAKRNELVNNKTKLIDQQEALLPDMREFARHIIRDGVQQMGV